jgi:DUF1680 family protein
VNNNSSTAYPLQFRKPYWATMFTLAINGKRQDIKAENTIVLDRVWRKGDEIKIAFDMPLVVLDGGKSYPGQVAFQRGPQVLAFDEKLNGFAANGVTVDAKSSAKKSSAVLPQNWIGGEAFEVRGEKDNAEKSIILVPYADASQTGGVISTWLKTANK